MQIGYDILWLATSLQLSHSLQITMYFPIYKISK